MITLNHFGCTLDLKKRFRGFSCLVLCVIYHPPSSDNNALIEHLTSKLDIALSLYPNAGIFLIEDFNRCPVSSVLSHFTLKQIVKVPTRGNSTLDLFLTNMSALCNPPVSLPPIGQSDHNSVLWSFNNGTTKYGCSKVKIRQGNNHNKRAFGNWLAGINWSNLFRANSCDHKLDIVHTVIKTALDYFSPAKLLVINPGLPQASRKLSKSGRERSEKVRGHNSVDYEI